MPQISSPRAGLPSKSNDFHLTGSRYFQSVVRLAEKSFPATESFSTACSYYNTGNFGTVEFRRTSVFHTTNFCLAYRNQQAVVTGYLIIALPTKYGTLSFTAQ